RTIPARSDRLTLTKKGRPHAAALLVSTAGAAQGVSVGGEHGMGGILKVALLPIEPTAVRRWSLQAWKATSAQRAVKVPAVVATTCRMDVWSAVYTTFTLSWLLKP